MKFAIKSLFNVVAVFIIILLALANADLQPPLQQRFQQSFTDDMLPHNQLSSDEQKQMQSGLFVYKNNKHISMQHIDMVINSSDGTDGILVYSGFKISSLFASAPNIDNHHQIVNSYLVGYSPFETDNLWIPYLTLSQRKSYQYDHLLYNGRQEVWQTSEQAFNFTRGDCEDHAIALADWLIELGEDARVVIGHHKEEGHAWVVLFKNGKEFLLEATRKVNHRSVMRYPLAKYETSYRPKYMFNRHDFWVNEGSVYTTRYHSDKWIKKSYYQL